MKTNEATAILKEFGCYRVGPRANHDWWYSPLTQKHFPVPRHGVHELPNGTKRNIEKLSGVKL